MAETQLWALGPRSHQQAAGKERDSWSRVWRPDQPNCLERGAGLVGLVTPPETPAPKPLHKGYIPQSGLTGAHSLCQRPCDHLQEAALTSHPTGSNHHFSLPSTGQLAQDPGILVSPKIPYPTEVSSMSWVRGPLPKTLCWHEGPKPPREPRHVSAARTPGQARSPAGNTHGQPAARRSASHGTCCAQHHR